MAVFEEYFAASCDCENRVHCCKWLPEDGNVCAVLQLTHGISEYIERYDAFARQLADNGIAVVGNDHLGHGKTCRDSEGSGFFGAEHGWFLVLEDMHRLTERTKSEFPNVPYFILGHSLGSFLCRTYLINYPGEVSGCILSGTGHQSPAKCRLGLAAAAAEKVRLGIKGRSALMNKLCFGAYSIHLHEVGAEKQDIGGIPTVSLITDMLGGIIYIQKRKSLMQMDKNTPVLFLSGAEDAVGEYGRGVKKAYDSFLSVGCTDVKMKLYSGGGHAVIHDANCAAFGADVLSWLKEHL